jgi:hypothetical protein
MFCSGPLIGTPMICLFAILPPLHLPSFTHCDCADKSHYPSLACFGSSISNGLCASFVVIAYTFDQELSEIPL